MAAASLGGDAKPELLRRIAATSETSQAYVTECTGRIFLQKTLLKSSEFALRPPLYISYRKEYNYLL